MWWTGRWANDSNSDSKIYDAGDRVCWYLYCCQRLVHLLCWASEWDLVQRESESLAVCIVAVHTMPCHNLGWCCALWVSSSTLCCRGFVSTQPCPAVASPWVERMRSIISQLCLSLLTINSRRGWLAVLHAQLLAILLRHCYDSWYGFNKSILLCCIYVMLWAGCDSLGGHDMAW